MATQVKQRSNCSVQGVWKIINNKLKSNITKHDREGVVSEGCVQLFAHSYCRIQFHRISAVKKEMRVFTLFSLLSLISFSSGK